MSEKTIDKYFINPDGEVVRCWPEHQVFAWDYLGPKITKKMATKGDAENYLKDRGWIRVQVYSEEGLGLEGTRDALNRNAQNILSILPNPRRVYVQPWPITGEGRYFGAEDLDRLGWDALAKKSKNRALFASLLREIASAKPEDAESLQDRLAKRRRA